MAKIDVNPDVLAWALKDAARTVEDVASVTGRQTTVVESWLAGQDSPNSGDLRKFAALLGRSPYFFVLPEVPELTPYSAQFRRMLLAETSSADRAQEIAALRWGQRIQQSAFMLAKGAGEGALELPEVPEDPSVAATLIRGWLDWDTVDQVSATSKAAAFKALRAAVEDAGVIVTMRAAGTRAFSGYTLPSIERPLIFINRDFDLGSVRSFTLMHEIGHVLRGDRRICFGTDQGIEYWCNRFSASFLMPEDHVRAYIEKKKLQFGSSRDTEPVRLVANRYKVSWLAAAIRLEEFGLAPTGLADWVRTSRPEPKEGGFSRGELRRRPQIRLEEFGSTFSRMLGDAVESGRVARLDAGKRLGVNAGELAEVFSVARHGERRSAGKSGETPL